MIPPPPELWGYVVSRWCPLPEAFAWVWWRALVRARWSTAVAWRARLLAFEAQDRAVSVDVVEAFLGETCTPQQLIDVLEELMHEKVLLRRDGHVLQDYVLRHVNKAGEWNHQHARRRM